MSILNTALELIKHFEGFRAEAYRLPGEEGWTVGFGRYGAKYGEVTTKEKEEAWVIRRINATKKQIAHLGFNKNQLEAVVSFIYNVGLGAFNSSTFLKRFQANDPKASEELLRWTKDSRGISLEGLMRRRKAEKALFDKPVENTPDTSTRQTIDLVLAAKYTTGDLPHQNEAWQWLQRHIEPAALDYFANKYRDAPKEVKVSQSEEVRLLNFPLISQRDNPGNFDGDQRADWLQTCNVTSCAMVINFLTKNKVTPTQLDQIVRRKYGSRYVHKNLVKLMRDYGVISEFDVSTTHDEIKESLDAGNPVIWSNKLTRGGHIAVVIGYNDSEGYYVIADPYGEPSPVNAARTSWKYKDVRTPYKLSYKSFDTVNANGYNYYKKEHWCHLCKKA